MTPHVCIEPPLSLFLLPAPPARPPSAALTKDGGSGRAGSGAKLRLRPLPPVSSHHVTTGLRRPLPGASGAERGAARRGSAGGLRRCQPCLGLSAVAAGKLALGSLRGAGSRNEMEPEEREDRTPLLKDSQLGAGEIRGLRRRGQHCHRPCPAAGPAGGAPPRRRVAMAPPGLASLWPGPYRCPWRERRPRSQRGDREMHPSGFFCT